MQASELWFGALLLWAAAFGGVAGSAAAASNLGDETPFAELVTSSDAIIVGRVAGLVTVELETYDPYPDVAYMAEVEVERVWAGELEKRTITVAASTGRDHCRFNLEQIPLLLFLLRSPGEQWGWYSASDMRGCVPLARVRRGDRAIPAMWPGVSLGEGMEAQALDFVIDDVRWPWGYDGKEVEVDGSYYFRAQGVRVAAIRRAMRAAVQEAQRQRAWRLKG